MTALCGYCEAPITDAPPRCLVCGGRPHRPSIVTELPPDRWLYCVTCQQPWPCNDSENTTQPEGQK